jgi:hypothetical protein
MNITEKAATEQEPINNSFTTEFGQWHYVLPEDRTPNGAGGTQLTVSIPN